MHIIFLEQVNYELSTVQSIIV